MTRFTSRNYVPPFQWVDNGGDTFDKEDILNLGPAIENHVHNGTDLGLQLDHASLTGSTTGDPHSQYVLLANLSTAVGALPPGPQGVPGTPGSVWLTGTAAPGAVGVDGDWYLNTANGDTYQKAGGAWTLMGNITGPQGVQGPQGIQGIQGIQGEVGQASTVAGPVGPQGAQGVQGPAGADSTVPGPTGATGADSTVAGPVGPAGADGAQGVPGVPGSKWYAGTGAPGAGVGIVGDWYLDQASGLTYEKTDAATWTQRTNLTGPQGQQGVQGVQGPVGAQGVAGIQGAAGTGITMRGQVAAVANLPPTGNTQGDAYLVQADDSLQLWDGTAWVSGGSIQGPPGPTGGQGAQGVQGTPGAVWYSGTGAPGAIGIQGDFYIDTASGQYYEQTSPGTWTIRGNFTGAQGIQGIQGVQGPPGADSTVQGPVGPAGADSTVAGPTGPQGIQGIQGIPGPAGSTWYSGTGAPGAIGVPGDWYLDRTSGDFFQQGAGGVWNLFGNLTGPQGPQGIQGIQGIQGPNGADSTVAGPQGVVGPQGPQGNLGVAGSVWFSAASAPAPGTGVPGDWSIDTATGNYYTKTDATTWLLKGNLVGPQGAQGVQGVPGADSTVAGPQGNQGIQGVAGPQGIEGPQGIQGVAGTGITMKGQVPDAASLPPTGNAQGDALLVQADDSLRIWDGTQWISGGSIQGPQGAQGVQGIQGPQGNQGVPGADSTVQGPVGATGAQGPAGAGLATGGTAGQVLVKVDATNYNTAWSPAPVIPTGRHDEFVPANGATYVDLTAAPVVVLIVARFGVVQGAPNYSVAGQRVTFAAPAFDGVEQVTVAYLA